jgi:type III restriction enzyme
MQPWQTTRACMPTQKSQISHVVYDSTWEKTAADLCEEMPEVLAWVKNDHLDFSIRYLWKGATKLFIPDYLIRLTNGKTLVLEIKGQDSDKNRAKRLAMQTWVEAVNEQGAFGHWCFDVVFEPAKIRDTLLKHAKS